MALERWINEQERKGNPQAVSFGKILLEKFGDVPLIDKFDYASVLRNATKEYKRNPESPEATTAFWQAFWNKNGNKIDFAVAVPPCPITKGQIAVTRKSGIGLIYVPESVASQENRHLLGKMFPKMHGHSVRIEDNEVRNLDSHSGWRFFDMQFEPVLLATVESEVRVSMEGRLADAPTLNEYIIASQAAKILTGKYLDEDKAYSRLLGSMLSGDTVVARFARNGELDVQLWPAIRYAPRVGARFSWPAR